MDNKKKLKQIVIFDIGKQKYATDIDKIISIERPLPITRVPNASIYIKGVINLRGEIIPLIKLNIILKVKDYKETDDMRLIIFKVDDISLAGTVNTIKDIIYIDDSTIRPLSNFNEELDLTYIEGIINVGGTEVTLINIEKLISLSIR